MWLPAAVQAHSLALSGVSVMTISVLACRAAAICIRHRQPSLESMHGWHVCTHNRKQQQVLVQCMFEKVGSTWFVRAKGASRTFPARPRLYCTKAYFYIETCVSTCVSTDIWTCPCSCLALVQRPGNFALARLLVVAGTAIWPCMHTQLLSQMHL